MLGTSTRFWLKTRPQTSKGIGCGSVGRAVASDSTDPRFESSHRQKIILNIYCQLY